MASGYIDRILILIDEIIAEKDKNSLNKKRINSAEFIAEQNRDKDGILKEVKRVLGVFNDDGKKYILSKMEAEMLNGKLDVVDSSGKLQVESFSEGIRSLAKETIKEARDSKVNFLASDKTIENKQLKESLLDNKDERNKPIEIIVDKFKNASFQEREVMILDWKKFSKDEKDAITKQSLNDLKEALKESGNIEAYEEVKRTSENLDKVKQKSEKMTDENMSIDAYILNIKMRLEFMKDTNSFFNNSVNIRFKNSLLISDPKKKKEKLREIYYEIFDGKIDSISESLCKNAIKIGKDLQENKKISINELQENNNDLMFFLQSLQSLNLEFLNLLSVIENESISNPKFKEELNRIYTLENIDTNIDPLEVTAEQFANNLTKKIQALIKHKDKLLRYKSVVLAIDEYKEIDNEGKKTLKFEHKRKEFNQPENSEELESESLDTNVKEIEETPEEEFFYDYIENHEDFEEVYENFLVDLFNQNKLDNDISKIIQTVKESKEIFEEAGVLDEFEELMHGMEEAKEKGKIEDKEIETLEQAKENYEDSREIDDESAKEKDFLPIGDKEIQGHSFIRKTSEVIEVENENQSSRKSSFEIKDQVPEKLSAPKKSVKLKRENEPEKFVNLQNGVPAPVVLPKFDIEEWQKVTQTVPSTSLVEQRLKIEQMRSSNILKSEKMGETYKPIRIEEDQEFGD